LLWALLSFALGAYRAIMLGRLIVDIVRNANPAWRPKGFVLVVAEICMTATDPPLKFVRRFIRPFRAGALSFDFAWVVIFIALNIAQGLVPVV
jgi:YggT family protein